MPQYAVEWGPGRKEEFLSWIQNELLQTMGDRGALETAWENAIIQWRARHSTAEVDFPYPGASNLEMPLTAMHSDPVYADLVQSLHASGDYWTPVARRRDTVDLVAPLRRGMTEIERRFLKMRRVNGKAFLDLVVQGSCVKKAAWRSEKRARRVATARGSERRILQVSEPSIPHVPLQRFFFPAYAWSLDFDMPGGAPWVAEEHRWNRAQYETYKESTKGLPGVDADAVAAAGLKFVDTDEAVRRQTQTDDKAKPFADVHVKVYEVWARFDTRGDGVFEDITVTIQLDAPSALRAIYFPMNHGKHPYELENYLPGFGIYGIGMAEVDEWAQEATTQLLNAQIDNVRLANTRMFKAPLGQQFAQQNVQAFPGKVWYVGPDEDIGEVRLSDAYPSGFAMLSNLMQFAELRSGVSELRQGNLSGLPSRTPATSLLSILREGNKRFDMVHSGIREGDGVLGLRTLQNVAQHAQDEPLRWNEFFAASCGPEDASKIMKVLLSPTVDEIEESFGITVTATSAQVNKEVEKQSFVGMLQIAQQIYAALVQTAQLWATAPDPVTKTTAAAAYASGVDILAQLFERFDVKNPEEHLGKLEQMAAMLNTPQGAQDPMMAMMAGGGMPPALGAQGFGGAGAPPAAIDPQMIAALLGMQ